MSTVPLSPLAQEVMDDLLRFCASTEDQIEVISSNGPKISPADWANAPMKAEPEDASSTSPLKSSTDSISRSCELARQRIQ